MKLGKDEVFMVPFKFCCFSARFAQGRIQVRAKIGHGGSPSTGCSNKPNTKQRSRSMWDEVLQYLVPFRSRFFDAF